MIQVFLSIVSGIIVGFVLGLLGGGESILVVPLLLYVVGMKDPHVVIGTTVSAVTINAYANLIPHVQAGTMCSGKWQSFLPYPVP
ncbi:TSUP family transporter [Bacillus sp. GB_SG_008]|uniref:TSUP family transporter n=1 Tax=Bacillus sp. GB_SG_008 TaxID=3454627 RepID=UPI003F87A582